MATGNIAAPRSEAKGPGFWQRTRDYRTAYMYVLPAGIVMTVITLYPLLFQVYMSFTDYGLQNLRRNSAPANWVGFDNFTNIVTGDTLTNLIPNWDFFRILTFNLWWALSNVVIHVILGVLIAVLLNIEGLWFKRIYRAIYILPVVIPSIIIATVWKKIFDSTDGPINNVMAGIFGIFGVPASTFQIPWLDNNQPIYGPLPLAYFALLTANIWLGWPLNSVVATGALQSIPKDLYEAAVVDGATGRQQFFSITVPMLRAPMLPFAIFGFITTFNLFALSYFMSEGNPYGKTELLVTQAYKLVNVNKLFGLAAAFSIYMFFILLILTLLTNKLAKFTASAD